MNNDQFYINKKLNNKIRLIKNNNQDFSTNANTANSNLLSSTNKIINKNNPLATSPKIINARLEYNSKNKFLNRKLSGKLINDKNINHHYSLSENKNYKNLINVCNNEVCNLLTEGKNNILYNIQNLDNKIMNNKNLKPIKNLDKLDYFNTPYISKYEKLPYDSKQKINYFRNNTTSMKKNNYRRLNDNNENIILINQDGVYLKENCNNTTTKLKNNKSNLKKIVKCPEEIHFFFVNSIQKGKELEEEFNNFNQ